MSERSSPRQFLLKAGVSIAASVHQDAGTIGINDGVLSTSICPFGGLKQSGWGRELGAEGVDAFLETKHISLGGIDGA